MKKTIIISMTLLLTGCLGDVGKGYITKTCEKTETINGLNKNTIITIKSKSGTPETIEIKETYDKGLDITSIQNSKKSEQNSYKQENGIELKIKNNEYIYTINTKEISEEIKERFNIKTEQHKQIKHYEEEGYTCK